jgi:hydrogenase nickel incorporation protein HypB
MCEECGCGDPIESAIRHHDHNHGHNHGHHHHAPETRQIPVNNPVMHKNDSFAAENRAAFAAKKLFVVNIMSSPGSGKTAIIELLAKRFGDSMAVIEGDIQTSRDAERVIRAGSRAYQIETMGACHLDARSVAHAIDQLDVTGVRLLVIENVGNAVCPASYDLGEHEKIAILSLPEGDDKVLKYPALFARVNVLLINKIDLAPYLSFDVSKAINECKSLNRAFTPFQVSATTGEGMQAFYDYLAKRAGLEP